MSQLWNCHLKTCQNALLVSLADTPVVQINRKLGLALGTPARATEEGWLLEMTPGGIELGVGLNVLVGDRDGKPEGRALGTLLGLLLGNALGFAAGGIAEGTSQLGTPSCNKCV